VPCGLPLTNHHARVLELQMRPNGLILAPRLNRQFPQRAERAQSFAPEPEGNHGSEVGEIRYLRRVVLKSKSLLKYQQHV